MMNNEKNIVILFLLILIISCANIAFSLSTNTFPQSFQSLRETIVALDVTRTKSQQTIKQLNLMQDMSLKKDIKEYAVFIEYLSYQIINYCQQINEQYSSRSVADLPCENQMNYSQSIDSVVSTKEMKTSEEQVSELENELMNSLGDFDEMLLKEDEQLAQVSRKQTSGNSSNKGENSQAQSGSSGNNNTSEAEMKNRENNENQESQTGKQQSDKNKASKNSGPGKGQQTTTGKNQSRERRKLDEIDDDIVARQLKEAAEKETDPQLKEKLWDEYYRYKKKTLKQ